MWKKGIELAKEGDALISSDPAKALHKHQLALQYFQTGVKCILVFSIVC